MKPFHYHEDPMYAAAAAILASQTVTEEAAVQLEESYPGAPVLTKAQKLQNIKSRRKEEMDAIAKIQKGHEGKHSAERSGDDMRRIDMHRDMLKKIDAREKQIMKMAEEEELEEGVEQIASAVEHLKKGDKTNFGVVTDIGSNSISFKAKDLPVTKIAFNQRKMGSKDFVLDKLVKLKEEVSLEEANYTTTKISDDDYEIDVHTKPRYDKSWQDDAKNVNDVRPFVKTIIADIQKFNSDFEFATFLEALIKQIKKESADSDHASYTIEALKDLNKALGKATVNFVANSDDAEPNYDIKPHIVKIIAKIDKVGVGYHYTVLLNALVKHLKTLSSESKAYKQLYKEIDKAVSLFNKELLEDVAVEEGIELDESIKTRIADLLLNLSGSDMSDMIKVAADTFKKNAIELSHSVAADKKDEYKKAIENMHAQLLHSKTLTDFEKNGKKLAVQMKSFKEEVSLEDVVVEDLEEGNGSYGMGTATITAPGNKLHGKQVSVFHKFDDGRLNVQFAKSDKKGDVLNLTLNKGQYKLD